ncbi:hypothetical protein J6590_020784 [Homalodisca vitripennis]|nr:hypothetical protein J6590_020784 [Homalodisca vitripennis]
MAAISHRSPATFGYALMVEARTPLAELLGYSKALRTIILKTASFSMTRVTHFL